MNTENLYLSSITNSTTKEYETKKSMFDMSKNRTTLVYNKIEMVRRTTFICSSTCRKAEHVEQPVFQLADTSYINADSLLTNFFYNTCPQGIKTVHKIEDKIDAGDFGCAQTLVNNFTPTNNIEQNYKDYYKLLLPYLTAGTWSDNVEGIALLNLANKCIYTNGLIISNARVLYNSIYRERFTVFNDECISDEEGEHGSGHGNKIGNTISSNTFEVEVYPNPTERGFDLYSNCNTNCNVNVTVRDINGQNVIKKECNLKEGNCFINTQLVSGIYMVTITKIDTKEQRVRKLLITNK